jgi:hypothetical protein
MEGLKMGTLLPTWAWLIVWAWAAMMVLCVAALAWLCMCIICDWADGKSSTPEEIDYSDPWTAKVVQDLQKMRAIENKETGK